MHGHPAFACPGERSSSPVSGAGKIALYFEIKSEKLEDVQLSLLARLPALRCVMYLSISVCLVIKDQRASRGRDKV